MKTPRATSPETGPAEPMRQALAQLRAGNAAGAREMMRRIVARWPAVPEVHAGLAQAARAEGDHAAALAAIEAALRLRPGVQAWQAARAEALAGLGRVTEAAAAYDRLIAANPGSARPRADKARMYQTAGDFEAAETAFRAALAIEPRNGELYRLFVFGKKLASDDPLVGTMERLWADPALPPESRIQLGFALAKVMEDTRQHDRVFGYLRPANEGMRRLHPYDVGHREREVEGLIRAFAGFDFASLPVADPGGFGPVFVTGMPRSGTTLVEQVLSAHPDVAGGGELPFFVRLALPLLGSPERGYRALGSIAAGEIAALASGYEARVRQTIRFASRVTDKAIQPHLVLGVVRLALPSARIVVVNRDPRDTLLSIYRNVFAPGTHLYAYDLRDLARYWKTYQRIVAFWREVMPSGFHEIGYETLVADPEAQTRALVAAAALPWDEACLSFTGNKRTVKTLSAHQVRQPLYASSVGAWKPYERELAPLLEELGDV